MPRNGPTSTDIGWSALAQILQYGSSLLALPVLLHFLSAESFGIWSAFILISGLIQLLDFGLQPSLIRHLSFAIALKHPTERISTLEANLEAGRIIYQKITLAVLTAQLSLGTIYLTTLATPFNLPLILAWIGFSLGTTLNFRSSYVSSVLQGLHKITIAQRVNAIGRALNLLVTTSSVAVGMDLLGTAAGAIAGGGITLFLAQKHLNYYRKSIFESNPEKEEILRATDEIWGTAKRLGSVSVAAFLILRSNALIAGSFLPLKTFAALSLATQLLQATVSLSRVHLTATIPYLSSIASNQNLNLFHQTYNKVNSKSWLIYILASQSIVWLVPTVIHWLNPSMEIFHYGVWLLLCSLYALEIIHGNASIALTCLNQVPFVSAAWLTGISILCLSLVAAWVAPDQLVIYISIQIFCQLAYNAWKWPKVLRDTLRRKN